MYRFDIDPANVDRDGIAEAQQLGGAGNLTLNGALADLGTALRFDIGDSYSAGCAGVQIGIYSAGNLSAVTFTVTGLDQDGNSATEAVTGPNNSTAETTKYYSRVTTVAAGAAVASDVEVGPVDEVCSISYQLNWRSPNPATVAVSGLSGTCQYDIDETFDNLLSSGTATINWVTKHSNKTADFVDALTAHATGVRLKIDSYSSGAELQLAIVPDIGF